MRALLLAVVIVVSGCGLDEFYTDLGDGALPGDPLNPLEPNVNCGLDGDVLCSCQGGGPSPTADVAMGADDPTGRAFRFAALVFTEPLKGMLGDQVNQFIAEEITAGNLHVALRVTGDDRTTGELAAELGPAQPKGSGYEFAGAPEPLILALAGISFTTTTPSSLDFEVNATGLNVVLPLRQVALNGNLPGDASAIENGTLTAVITAAEAAHVTLLGAPLDLQLRTIAGNPNTDSNGDGTDDAWEFRGTYAAEQVEFP